MSCEVMTREFNNSKGEPILFAVRQLPATKSLELYVDLMRTFGAQIFPFIDDKYALADIVMLMRAAEQKTFVDLFKRVVATAVIDGEEIKPAKYDIFFNGELMLACKVFAFVTEVNFADFLQQGLEMNEQRSLEEAARLKRAEQQNSSQKT